MFSMTPGGPTPLLETKLYIPRWPEGLVTRPALTDRIGAGVDRRLTIISAPAGSGKTTLLAEWLVHARAPDSPAASSPPAWVSLDIGDNDPVLFWQYVIGALQRVQPSLGEDARALLHAHAAPTVEALTSLINSIVASDVDVVLILDDYHVIDAPAVHTGLAYFLDHLPPRMHVVMATRADPPLPLARLRARGQLTELRAPDLRFNADQAGIFFNRVMSLDVSAEDVSALEAHTEGWIAGLKLAGLSMQGHSDVQGFVAAFTGDNRYITDYLVEEVLQAQPERVRRFLLDTAMLERLSGPLCDAVAGETGSQKLLDSLERNNLFVNALDDRREYYRYHHLFAEVLQAHAVREDREHVRELDRRASIWYERSGAVNDAVRHADRAEDTERVADLLERAWPPMDRSYQTGRWLARVRSLPDAVVRRRPVLHMGYVWGLLNAGELEAASDVLDDVAKCIADAAGHIVADEDQFRTLPREILAARVYLAQSRGDTSGTVGYATELLDLVPADDHMARAKAQALLALGHYAAGELETAHRTFTRALASMREAGDMLSAIRGVFVPGDIRATQGRLRDAEQTYRSGLQLAAEHTQLGAAETDELYLGLSDVCYERDELQQVERILHDMEQTPRVGHAGNVHRWCTAMARLAAARGDHARTLQLLADADTHERRDPLPRVRPVEAIRARVQIAQGDIAAATKWADLHAPADGDELTYVREYEHITLARLLIARGDSATDLLERIVDAARTGGRLRSVIEALALNALAHHAGADMRAAMDAISAALELAEPEGYIRIFVDEGMPMRDLLRHATARGIGSAFTRRVLAAFEETAVRDAAAESDVPTPRTPQLLTSRELEILRLIAAGMRNQEIADQLFISPATVKRHIANIYDKLGARHRTDALRRAGALNVL